MTDADFEFRLADDSDAHGVGEVKQAVWATQEISLEQIASALGDLDHQTFVAVENDRIAGYMACFKTVAQDGTERWEMDELAVHPDFQRRGLAQALVKAGTKAAHHLNIPTARALIQVENTASQRTFSRWGYKASTTFYGLHISTQRLDKEIELPADLHLVPVNTLSYCGVWVEGRLSHDGFLAARAYCAKENRSVAGALIPIDNRQAIYAAANAGYEAVSNYQWWTLELES